MIPDSEIIHVFIDILADAGRNVHAMVEFT